MAQTPWKAFAKPNPERDYVAVVSYLPLKSFWALPQFFYYTLRIQSQLKSARGLVGYYLLAHVLTKRFWTLSVWESEVALIEFVHKVPHRQCMMILRRHLGGSKFLRWQANGSAIPPRWQEALERLRRNQSPT